jgi:hypothetical protein
LPGIGHFLFEAAFFIFEPAAAGAGIVSADFHCSILLMTLSQSGYYFSFVKTESFIIDFMNSPVKQSARDENVKGVIFAGFRPCHSAPRGKSYTAAQWAF